MKTIILSLIICFTLHAQGLKTLGIVMDGGYKNPETTLYLAGQTVSPTQAARIDRFISMLKDSLSITSLSSKFDVFYLFANETSVLALRNLVKRSNDATVVVTPTFTQWQGYTKDGNNSYLRTHFIPSTDAITYTQNSAHAYIYIRAATNQSTTDYGGMGASTVFSLIAQINYGVGLVYAEINKSNDGSGRISGVTNTGNPEGSYLLQRTGTTAIAFYKNGSTTALGTGDGTSSGVPQVEIYIIGYNNNGSATSFTTKQYSIFSMGSKFTTAEWAKFNNCVEWYMDQLGTGIQ
jgi:hypothetical protein